MTKKDRWLKKMLLCSSKTVFKAHFGKHKKNNNSIINQVLFIFITYLFNSLNPFDTFSNY